jgi:hypothetical protein
VVVLVAACVVAIIVIVVGFLATLLVVPPLPVVAWRLLLLLAVAGELTAGTTARGGRDGEERCARRNLLPVGETQLLENELVSRVGEDEGGLRDGSADVVWLVSSGLDAEAVLVDRVISLGHGMEFMTQEDRPRCLIHLEESFNGKPQLTGRLNGVVHGLIEDRVRDKPEDPTTDATVCLLLGNIDGVSSWNRVVQVPEEAEFPTHCVEMC